MASMEPRQGTPEELSLLLDEEFENGTTHVIVFAGPKLLDPHFIDRWDRGITIEGPDFEMATDEDDRPETCVPVVNEFYSEFELYADNEIFQELVQEGPVCLVVRPRRFDYLYTRTELSEW